MKHLSIFELLEFKDWWKDLDNEERVGLDIIIGQLRARILKGNVFGEIDRLEKFSGRYRIGILKYNKCDLKIIIAIDRSKRNRYKDFGGLEKFTNERIQALLDCILKEIFVYSNFQQYNELRNLKFYSDRIRKISGNYIITSGIKTRNREPLKMKYL